jgi:hypothetical protein
MKSHLALLQAGAGAGMPEMEDYVFGHRVLRFLLMP